MAYMQAQFPDWNTLCEWFFPLVFLSEMIGRDALLSDFDDISTASHTDEVDNTEETEKQEDLAPDENLASG